MQARLHQVGGGVFVGRRPPPTLSGPLLWNWLKTINTVFLGAFTHTHTKHKNTKKSITTVFKPIVYLSPVQSGQKCPFYHSFSRPTRTKWRNGCSATWKMPMLPHFWASDTHEVTKRLLGYSKNAPFTTVWSVRHARSDERVARPCTNFAFEHSFERPTREVTKGSLGDVKKTAFYNSLERPTRTKWRELSNPQVRFLRPGQT